MEYNLLVRSLDIIVAAQNHNPSILNPDFLYRNKIVNEDWGWELARDPISTPPFSQVVFKSGVSISAQFERVIFSETEKSNLPEGTRVADIATKYAETLPHVTYTAIGINPKGHVLVESSEAARAFIMDRLIREGPWTSFGDAPVTGSAKLVFDVEEAKFILSVDQGEIAEANEPNRPCVLFQGNFHRDVKGEDHDAKFEYVRSTIKSWRKDYDLFVEVIQSHFLEGAQK